jgi:thymidylate synthase ThyX
MSPGEAFTPEERETLERHFTNIDEPVFALVNLPDVVKGALFSRYSRSAKSLKRLFLDEFRDDVEDAGQTRVGLARAEDLYERVFVEYGDDSVAQLVGAHIAVEDASNVLTKVLEWGRLMSYLEQSTRYVPYNDRPAGRWRYHVPDELSDARLRSIFCEHADHAFETYERWFAPVQEYFQTKFPRADGVSKFAYRMSIQAKVCDTLRGLLPAATTSNVGLYGSAQAFEALLLRLQRHPLAEARVAGDRILRELRKVMPVFLRRIDNPERGGVWSDYLRETSDAVAREAAQLASTVQPVDGPRVTLTDFDADGETKVVAAALYSHTRLSDDQLLAIATGLPQAQRDRILRVYVGDRKNRRHRPGRAFERTRYRFDVIADYAAFRDLQRHRMLTLDWQPLSPDLGFETPAEIADVGAGADWSAVMEGSARVHAELVRSGLDDVAPYAVSMAYRLRFYMDMNAREAMHMIELRTAPEGHPNYRYLCREMLRLIAGEAGHRAIAAAMTFAHGDEDDASLERLESEIRNEAKRASLAGVQE